MGSRVLLAITKSELGGAQRYVDQLARLLPRHGFEPVVACGGSGWLVERAREAGAKVVQVSSLSLARTFRGLSEVEALRELEGIVREGGYDVVHGNSTRAGFLARLAARRAGVPAIVFTAHGFFFLERMTGWRQAVYTTAERLAARWSDAIITVSEADRAAALRSRLCHAEKLVTIRNGLDEDSARRLQAARENGGRAPAGGGEAPGPLVAAVANLYPTKGLDHLIVAMAEVRRMEPSARLLIIGEGPERPRLEALTRAHRLEDGITLAGKMPDPWNLLPGAKVFVLSSVKEGLPFVLLEAMAAGIPIVASRVGGIPEIVTDEHSALLVPPGDPPALARAICRLLQDGELGAALARAAQATLRRDELTADAMVAATADLYRRLLAARRVR